MMEAGLKELLLHHCYFWVTLVHVPKHLLAFILELSVYERTGNRLNIKTYGSDRVGLLYALHPDCREHPLGDAPSRLSHDATEAQGPGQQHRPPDQIGGHALPPPVGVYRHHRDVEQLLCLKLVKKLHVPGPELPVHGEEGSVVLVDHILIILRNTMQYVTFFFQWLQRIMQSYQ